MKENFEEAKKLFVAYCLRPAKHNGKEIILHVIVGNDPFSVDPQMADIMVLKIGDGVRRHFLLPAFGPFANMKDNGEDLDKYCPTCGTKVYAQASLCKECNYRFFRR